jgi:tetratricopeptide (TPR) repeat protein
LSNPGSTKKYNEFIECLDEVIKIIPTFAKAYYVKGVTLKSLGRTSEADIAYAKAKELGTVNRAQSYPHFSGIAPGVTATSHVRAWNRFSSILANVGC